MKKIIFKVQISLFTSENSPQVMLYNEKRDISGQFPLSKDIKKLVKGRPKFFVYGEMIGTEVTVLGEAPWQDW